MFKGFLRRNLLFIVFRRIILFGKKYIPIIRIPWFGLWHIWAFGASTETLCGIKINKPIIDKGKVFPFRLNVCSKCNKKLMMIVWK